MGEDRLSPQNDSPGNAAYRDMRARLAAVTARERRRARGGGH